MPYCAAWYSRRTNLAGKWSVSGTDLKDSFHPAIISFSIGRALMESWRWEAKRETKDGDFRLGGIGEIVAREIAQRTGKETRCCVLGHLQRGGAPTTLDRILGTRFGVKAVQLANEGHFGSMVSYQNYQVRRVPIAEAVNRLRLVPPNGEMIQTARDVEISFGD
jgi:6-phosphofructokinase